MAHIKKKHAPLPPATAVAATHRATNGGSEQPIRATSHGRDLELSVVLPGGVLSSITVDYSTAMADVLVLIAAKHKLTPSEHVLSVLSEETGHQLSYTSLQAIGSLQVKRVYLLSRKTPKKEEPTGVATVVVSLPRGRRSSYDFAAKTSIAHAYRVVCADKGIDPSSHSILLPGADSAQPPTELTSTTLGESGIEGFSILPNKSPSRYHSMMDVSSQSNGLHRGQSMAEKKARSSGGGGGFFAFFRRKKKSKESSDSNSSQLHDANLPAGAADVTLSNSSNSALSQQPPTLAGTAVSNATTVAAKPPKPQASVKPQVHVPAVSYRSETDGGDATESADQHTPSSSSSKSRKKQHAPQPPSLRSDGSSGASSAGGTSGTTGDVPPSPTSEPPLPAVVVREHISRANPSPFEAVIVQHGYQSSDQTAAAPIALVPALQSPVDGSLMAAVATSSRATVACDAHREAVSTAVQNSAVQGNHASAAAAASGSHGKKSRAPPPPATNADPHSSGEIYHADCELGFANPSAASACASAPAAASIATAAAVTAPAASGSGPSWPVFVAPPPPKYPPPPNSPPLSGGGDGGSSSSPGGGSRCSSPGSVHRELLCAGLQSTVTDLQGCGAMCPGLDSHASEILRSASRNSEASVDTIADVTRSFEQAIVEGQNALKEQWQDLQPRIADFVASMDVLTEDLQQGAGSNSRTAPVAAQGTLDCDSRHLGAAGLPAHAESQYLLPTTDAVQRLASGKDSETTASPSRSDSSSVVPKSQALTSSLSPSLTHDKSLADASLISAAPRRTAVSSSSSSAQAVGAGDWSTAVGSSTPPAGDELIVGGDEPRHPFVSDRVWQDLTDPRLPLPHADEAEAQRLLRLLTTAALPSDDPVGSVRGVKGGVRATRSRLFADDDRSFDRDDESSEVAAVEPMVTPRLAGVVTSAAAVGTAAAPAAVEARESDRNLATVEVAATTMQVNPVALTKKVPLSTQGAPSASTPVMSRDATGIPRTNGSATAAAAAVDVLPIAASGLSVGDSPAPTDVAGATVVRARPAVVTQPAALDQTDEAKRRSLLVLAASSPAAHRPDLNDVPMPAKVSMRSEGVVVTGFKDETEVKLRAVAGRSSISSSTTQLFSRRSQTPNAQASITAVGSPAASTQSAAASEAAVAEAAVASPSATSYGGVRLPSVQSPNEAHPNRPSTGATSASGATADITVGAAAVATAASAGQLGLPASSTSSGLGQRANIVIIEAAGDDRQKIGDDVQPNSAKKSTSPSMPAAANSSLPPIGSAGSRATEMHSANGPDGNSRAHAMQRDGAASTDGTDMPRSAIQHASTEESAQTGSVVEPVTTAAGSAAAASVRRTRGTDDDMPRPAGLAALLPSSVDAPIVAASAYTQVAATSVRLLTTDANIEPATAVVDRSDVAAVSASSSLIREGSESKVSSDKSTDRHSGDGNARALVGLEAAAATALPGVSVRASGSGSNAPPSNQPRKTIFSLLSSLDSKQPIVKKRSSTLPLADEPTTEREDPSDALKERSGSVVDRPVRRTAAGGIYASDAIPAAAAVEALGRPSKATLATAEPRVDREAAMQKATVTPLVAKLPSSAQPLQARLFSPRPFVTRQTSTGAEETGSVVTTVRPSAAEVRSAPTSERRLSTAASAPSAVLPGNEQALPKEQPHAFRLSVSASPADAEARRKQELVRRYEDLQKDVAAWRGQLAQNETVIRDVTTRSQRHSAGPLVASQSSGEKSSASADTPTAPPATAAATSATGAASTNESVAAGSDTVLRAAVASAPRPRMAASLPRASDNHITLESMVAQMTQVKLKPATERAAKSSNQQQQPPLKSSDSRELLLQSIRDRGERLKLVVVNDSEAEPAQPQQQQQRMKPSEEGGSRRAQLSGSGSSSSLSQSTSSSSLSSLPAPPVPPPLPPTMLSLTSQPQPSNASKRTSAVLKTPSQSVDPREELMIAIRSFGGAMKLRTATSSPAATPR